MTVRRTDITLTTDASGAGTAVSARPISGQILEIRQPSAGWGGTADYTFTRAASEGGGTVVALTDKAGPFSVYPGGSVQGLTNVATPVPVDGHLILTIAQAAAATAGTVHVFYR